MAITHAAESAGQVKWSTSDSVSVTAGSNQTSDELNIDDTCIAARITMKADNSTTPASDDQIYVWLLESSGDPDGASTDEFVTTEHAILLAVLDTAAEDPAIAQAQIPLPQKGLKIYAEGATAGTTNSITVSAQISQQLAA